MASEQEPGLVHLGEATVPCGRDAPAVARRLVAGWLDGRASSPLIEDACLLVSELVANSVIHAGQPAGAPLRIAAGMIDDDLVRLAVSDLGHGPIRRRTPSIAEGGYGLHLVEMVAERWGTSRERGTEVWFELAPRGQPA
jgi:anti-sigma regulatory factor (Ser/Thr protein kinase)